MLRQEALSITKIGKMWGCNQPIMRDTIIQDLAYLDPYYHNHHLNVGDIQRMYWRSHDMGSFHLSALDRLRTKYDRDKDIFLC